MVVLRAYILNLQHLLGLFWGGGLGCCCSFTRCLLASKLELICYRYQVNSYSPNAAVVCFFQNKYYNSWWATAGRLACGCISQGFTEWNHLCTTDNCKRRRKVYSVTRCQQKIILKNTFPMFTLPRAIHFSIANDLKDYVVPKHSLGLIYVWFLNNL